VPVRAVGMSPHHPQSLLPLPDAPEAPETCERTNWRHGHTMGNKQPIARRTMARQHPYELGKELTRLLCGGQSDGITAPAHHSPPSPPSPSPRSATLGHRRHAPAPPCTDRTACAHCRTAVRDHCPLTATRNRREMPPSSRSPPCGPQSACELVGRPQREPKGGTVTASPYAVRETWWRRRPAPVVVHSRCPPSMQR
jgi:hypothetical protein